MPGVEADDVIGTLAMRSIGAGFKVLIYNYSSSIHCLFKAQGLFNFSIV